MQKRNFFQSKLYVNKKYLAYIQFFIQSNRFSLFDLQEFSDVLSERDSTASEGEFFEKIVGNPIHAYKMMKRFSVDLGKIEKDLKEDDWSGEN